MATRAGQPKMICDPAVAMALAVGMFSSDQFATSSRTFSGCPLRSGFSDSCQLYSASVVPKDRTTPASEVATWPVPSLVTECPSAESNAKPPLKNTSCHHILRDHDQRFAVLTVLLQVEVLKGARVPLEARGDRTAGGNQQSVAGYRQIALGRHTALGFRSRNGVAACRVRRPPLSSR